jgi:hypothetical protein
MSGVSRIATISILVTFLGSTLAVAPGAGALDLGGALGGALGGLGGALGGSGSSGSSSSGTSNSSSGSSGSGSSSGSSSAGASLSGTLGRTTANISARLQKRNFAKNATISATLGKTTNINAKALSAEIDVTLSLGRTNQTNLPATSVQPSRTVAARAFRDLSETEQRKLRKKCSYVLAYPSAFESDLVALCRIIVALQQEPAPATSRPKKKQKAATAKPRVAPERVASVVPAPPPTPAERKADKQLVSTCAGPKEKGSPELEQLKKDIPGCVIGD